jgi:hypothetical protein
VPKLLSRTSVSKSSFIKIDIQRPYTCILRNSFSSTPSIPSITYRTLVTWTPPRSHSTMSTRKKPMKVIVGGMPRTSTVSITSALRELGFTPYDYFVRLRNGDLPQWNHMLKAKYHGSRQPLDREHLDRLTGNYDVSARTPFCPNLSGRTR